MAEDIGIGRQVAGISTEVGTGIATDFATTGLLGGGPLGWLAYAGINFGQGAYTNYLVQKHLYGNENINWGEVIASGGMGMIPFMNIGASKGVSKVVGQAGSIKRGLVGGALTGLAGEQTRVGIDEQRFLNPLEAVTAAGVGGGLSGGLTKLSKLGKQSNVVPKFDPTGNQIKTDAVTQVSQKLGVDPEIALQREGLRHRIMKQIDGLDSEDVQESQEFIHSVYPKRNRGLYKQLDQQGVLDEAEVIVKNLDAFKNTEGKIQKYARWNPNRPTTGFKGTRTVKYINSSGVPSEVAFRWSISENTYVPYDLVRRQNTILKRMRWNVNRSLTSKRYADQLYKRARSDNALFIKLLKELRKNDPQAYFDIMGDTRKYATNKGFIYVEHIHPQNSPWWKYMDKGSFKPRDTANLMIAKEEFGKLKTNIENEIYNNKNFKFPDGKRLLLDYDKVKRKFILKQLQDNGRLKWVGDISAITNPRDWRKALNAALRGHKIEDGHLGEIKQVVDADTDIPKLVDAIHRITDWKKNDPYE